MCVPAGGCDEQLFLTEKLRRILSRCLHLCENGIVCGWAVILFIYNMGLLLALLAGAPVWLLRPRWREGLRERLGTGAARVGHALAGRQQVWVHAVSVGEVVAASRLVEELDARLGRGSVAISTTTHEAPVICGSSTCRARKEIFWATRTISVVCLFVL